MRHGWLLAPLLLSCASAPAQVTSAERDAIANALKIANFVPEDFEFDRRPDTVRPLIPMVGQMLQKPLTSIDDLIAFHQFAEKGSLPSLLDKASSTLGLSASALPEAANYLGKVPETIPPEFRAPIETIIHAIAASNDVVRLALSRLSPEDRRVLIEELPKFASKGAPLDFSFSKSALDEKRVLSMIEKVDVSLLIRAAARLSAVVRIQLPLIEDAAKKSEWKETVITKVDGVTIEVSGKGDDVHSTSDSMLCIDLGGRNQYTGRYGAGIGYTSVLISLGSLDTFDTPDASVGCGLLGIGLAYVAGGNDQFNCGSLSLGAGVGGVGTLVKSGGSDHYRAKGLAMGFGQYGVGLLVDTGGDNDYVASVFSQGCARTAGIGWLINRLGYHTYRCLSPEGVGANSQGWSSGYPEDRLPGGIGLLTDFGSGFGIFDARGSAQAVGLFGGLGSLYCSSSGNTFESDEGQGFGRGGGVGAFITCGGDNTLLNVSGPCHGLGFDQGVGLLICQGDHNLITGTDARPGTGYSGGIGVFLGSGNGNRFFDSTVTSNAPHPGVGLFVNLGIEAKFEGALESGEATVSQGWTVALSQETAPRSPVQSPTQVHHPTPGSEPMPSDAVIDSIYTRAVSFGEVGRAAATTAFDRLVAIGVPAVAWIVDHKLLRASTAEVQLTADLIGAVGPQGQAPLAKLIEGPEEGARVGLKTAALADATTLGSSIAKALSVPELQLKAAETAGILKSKDAVAALLPLTISKDGRLAQAAILALADIGDLDSVPTAEVLLASNVLPIRKAAMRLIVKFPERALDWADRTLKASDERTCRMAIELLGLTGTPNALSRVGPYLKDLRAGIRIQALLALDGQCPTEFRAAAAALRQDNDSLVRSVALGINFDR